RSTRPGAGAGLDHDRDRTARARCPGQRAARPRGRRLCGGDLDGRRQAPRPGRARAVRRRGRARSGDRQAALRRQDRRAGLMSAVLELDGVTKRYGEPPVWALRGVSFAVEPGESAAIVGPSGSGKSTLLHVLGTLERPTDGRVSITGIDVAELSDRELAALRATTIGFVFQQFFLAEHATIEENVADGLLYAGVRSKARRELARDALSRVGLGERLNARPPQLSGGERQRVAIARALVGKPAIMLADEPTGNLDSATGRQILALLDELHAQGAAILVITHERDIAERFPRQITVRDGRVV